MPAMYSAVMIMLEIILLLVGGLSVLFLIACFVGAACGYFAGTRPSVRRQMKPMSELPEPEAYELWAALTKLDEGLLDRQL